VNSNWILAAATAAGVAVVLTGCAIPVDPEGTLDKARGGVLHVGATESTGWVSLSDDSAPSGLETDLIREFAEQQDADIEWTAGSEYELIGDLEHGRLDVVIGGFADDTPWSDRAAITRPYTEIRDEDGQVVRHVMLARMGENALLLALDRFLLEKDVRP